MNKKEMIELISVDTSFVKADVELILNAFISNVKKGVKKGAKVSIPAFGIFEKTRRNARDGRNPITGETIKIAAKNAVKFKPSKTFKDELN